MSWFIGFVTHNSFDLFQGNENILEFQEIYTKTFKCEYELQMYPFDTQVSAVHDEIRYSSLLQKLSEIHILIRIIYLLWRKKLSGSG